MALPKSFRTLSVSLLFPPATAASGPGSATGRRRLHFWSSAACALATALLLAPGVAAQATAHAVGEVTLPVNGFPVQGQVGTGIVDVALDGRGNVYFTTDNGLLEELPKQGNGYGTPMKPIPTIRQQAYRIAVNKAGDIFVRFTDNSVVKYPYMGKTYGTPTMLVGATAPNYLGPSAIAVDGSDNLYVAGSGNYSILSKLPFSGGRYGAPEPLPDDFIGTFQHLTIDAQGNIFGVTKLLMPESPVPAEYHVVELKRNGSSYAPPILLAGRQLGRPGGIAVDLAGNVFINDGGNYFDTNVAHGLYQLSPSRNGTYGSLTLLLELPYDGSEGRSLAVDARGALYEAEGVFTGYSSDYYGSLRKIERAPDFGSTAVRTPLTKNVTFAFDSAGTAGRPAVVSQGAPGPEFVDTGAGTCTTNGAAHTYAVGDTCTVQVRFTPGLPGTRYGGVQLLGSTNSATAAFVQGLGVGPQVGFLPGTQSFPGNTLSNPAGVALAANGDLYLADAGTGILEKLPALSRGGLGTPVVLATGLASPGGVAVDSNGSVYVVETGKGQIRKIPLNSGTYGAPVVAVSGLQRPRGVAVDGLGNLYVTNSGKKVVELYRSTYGAYSSPQTLPYGFTDPGGIAVDGSGNVFVTDAGNGALKIIPFIQGAYTTPETLHTGFANPGGVAVDGNDNVYVAETGRSVIREIPFTDRGYGPPLTLGNGLLQPLAVAVDGNNLYAVDQGRDTSRRVRLLNLSQPPRYDAGSVKNGTFAPSTLYFTVSNSGNAPLLFPVPTTGTNPSVPSEYFVSTACPPVSSTAIAPAVLDRGNQCAYSVNFRPRTGGDHSGQIVFTDNNLNIQTARQVIPVTATTPRENALSTYVADGYTATFGDPTVRLYVSAQFSGKPPRNAPTIQVDAGARLLTTCYYDANSDYLGDLYCAVDYPLAGLSVGQHTITAVYDGDVSYFPFTATGAVTILAAKPAPR